MTDLYSQHSSPNIIFNDADVDQAVKWAAFGILYVAIPLFCRVGTHRGYSFNHGQCCCAGSRVYVQSGVYDQFTKAFNEHIKSMKVGDPFDHTVTQGPQVSQLQQERIIGYIEAGKKEGATVMSGGNRHGNDGYFVQPTVFTDTKPHMKIVKEEIFGPVVVSQAYHTACNSH
jgi:aldehyde dehydrogenase (NAD+)